MKYMLPQKLLYYSTLCLDHAVSNIEGVGSDCTVCKEGRPVRRKTLKDLRDSCQATLPPSKWRCCLGKRVPAIIIT